METVVQDKPMVTDPDRYSCTTQSMAVLDQNYHLHWVIVVRGFRSTANSRVFQRKNHRENELDNKEGEIGEEQAEVCFIYMLIYLQLTYERSSFGFPPTTVVLTEDGDREKNKID
ncbi:hypothetical protein CLF_100462 [Clonorchis sinensis]|uniref:Uncharacterized protein n=1 Tax=Clonorchis sinensis TaxID=79923 RepID=G7Y3I2_CLOSI|nr:hypothetical protein CLF_100462 [Clonorchis sinensis]